MFELRRRTRHVYSLRWGIQGLKKTSKRAVHLYSCMHNATITLSAAPEGNNTSYVTSTRDQFTPPDKHVVADTPSSFSLIFWFGWLALHSSQTLNPILVVHGDKRVTWYYVVVHIASFMAPAEHWGKTPAARHSLVHFCNGNFTSLGFCFVFLDPAHHLQT